MIDNCNININNLNINKSEILNMISNKECIKIIRPNKPCIFKYKLDNQLSVILTNNRLNISGSLSKYYHGSNLYDLKFNDYPYLIDKLSTDLKYDVSNGHFTKIELGTTISVDHNIEKYLGGLLYSSQLRTSAHNSTLYFTSSYRKIMFYNKIEEINSKYNPLNIQIPDLNLLRFEVKLLKNVESSLCKKLVLKDLTNFNEYITLCDYVLNQYNIIKKRQEWNPPLYSIHNPTKLMEFALIYFIENFSSSQNNNSSNYLSIKINDMINMLQANDLIAGKNTKTKIRNKIHSIYNQAVFTSSNPFIEELDEKLKLYLTSYI